MDESGILPKARYAMTICHCLDQLLVGGGGGRCKPPPVGPRQSRGGVQGAKFPEAQAILQYTEPKKWPPKPLSWYILSVCCIKSERKNSFKLKKFMCKANISTSCSVNISLVTLKHGRHNELTSFQHNHY